MVENKLKIWLSAFRLRTLPLALSCILTGTGMVYALRQVNVFIFIAAIITTILLQILSNLSNDYGDGVKGTDNDQRIGPKRAVQSGAISLQAMKTAIIINVVCCLVSGISLLYISFGSVHLVQILLFLLLGILAIAAAIKYTIGANAYGYNGLGDLAVFVFFGLVGVLGSAFLYTQSVVWYQVFPAISIGLLSIGVLNLNNMRDIENDRASGKMTLPVKMGLPRAKAYHYVLIWGAILSMIFYSIVQMHTWWQSMYSLVIPLFIKHLIEVRNCREHQNFNSMLPKLAISTFIMSLLFFIGERMAVMA